MRKHIFYVNNIQQLNLKKDSSLHWALSLQLNEPVYLLFPEDLGIVTKSEKHILSTFKFSGNFGSDQYIEDFKITGNEYIEVDAETIMHFRLDPPVDENYLKSIWLVDYLKDLTGCTVINDPKGIMKHNEKIIAFKEENSLPSYVGESVRQANLFVDEIKEEYQFGIMKPLNSFSGHGIRKFDLHQYKVGDFIEKKLKESKGGLIIQPFDKRVIEGELRTCYWRGECVGTIIKVPAEGSFLSNVAQGATFEKVELDKELDEQCQRMCKELMEDGIEFAAFDILGGNISEINITCPGLLVEVSHALGENVSAKLVP